ncbi:MAG: RecQ family ATP-dependent DNA helicase [Chloroflexota bacterium]
MTRGTPQLARAALHDLFGFSDYRPGQEPVVSAICAGQDVLSIMPTGAGKSLCYQLAAMIRDGCTLVISPLLALMKDQLDGLPERVLAQTTVFNSQVERAERDRRMELLARGGVKLVYATPERLRQRSFLRALGLAGVSLVVVDEAHCISLWGHDFRPDYLFVQRALELLGRPQLLALTATATTEIQQELDARFGRRLTRIMAGVLRENLHLEVLTLESREQKLRELANLVGPRDRGSGIVYVRSRQDAEELATFLKRRGIAADHYHAGLETSERNAAQAAFMENRTRVMVATTAFGMGIDKADVRFVVHFSPPESIEAYVQESGRAGRDGKPARCVMLATASDRGTLRRRITRDRIGIETLRAVYGSVRSAATDGFLTLKTDRLAALAPGTEESVARAAVSLLERAGLLRRHLDVPGYIDAELTDPSSTDRWRSARGSTPAVARALGLPPAVVEDALLDRQARGEARVTMTGRELLIELLPAPPDAAKRVDQILESWDQVQEQRLDTLVRYLQSRACRHALIARHFGTDSARRCTACDNCDLIRGAATGSTGNQEAPSRSILTMHPRDVTLACVQALPFPLGREKLGLILRGSVEAPLPPERARFFGALEHLTAKAIRTTIEELVAEGFLTRDEGEYPVLLITDQGREKQPEPPPRTVSVADKRSRKQPSSADDPGTAAAFERLRAWRRQRASADGVAPFIVSSDATLLAIARAQPRDTRELALVDGIGPAKVERYGGELIEVVRSAGPARP